MDIFKLADETLKKELLTYFAYSEEERLRLRVCFYYGYKEAERKFNKKKRTNENQIL